MTINDCNTSYMTVTVLVQLVDGWRIGSMSVKLSHLMK